jgi:hypothetical protein
MRRDLAIKIRGLLKTFGLVVGKVGERAYAHRVRESSPQDLVRPLLPSNPSGWRRMGGQTHSRQSA